MSSRFYKQAQQDRFEVVQQVNESLSSSNVREAQRLIRNHGVTPTELRKAALDHAATKWVNKLFPKEEAGPIAPRPRVVPQPARPLEGKYTKYMDDFPSFVYLACEAHDQAWAPHLIGYTEAEYKRALVLADKIIKSIESPEAQGFGETISNTFKEVRGAFADLSAFRAYAKKLKDSASATTDKFARGTEGYKALTGTLKLLFNIADFTIDMCTIAVLMYCDNDSYAITYAVVKVTTWSIRALDAATTASDTLLAWVKQLIKPLPVAQGVESEHILYTTFSHIFSVLTGMGCPRLTSDRAKKIRDTFGAINSIAAFGKHAEHFAKLIKDFYMESTTKAEETKLRVDILKSTRAINMALMSADQSAATLAHLTTLLAEAEVLEDKHYTIFESKRDTYYSALVARLRVRVSTVEGIQGSGKIRQVPVGLLFRSKPGVGKNTMIGALTKRVYSILQEEVADETCFFLPLQSDWHDGLKPTEHKNIVMDEFLGSTEPQKLSNQCDLAMALIGGTALRANMAVAEQKAGTHFLNEITSLLTNHESLSNSFVKLNYLEALGRRYHSVEVLVDSPHYDPETHLWSSHPFALEDTYVMWYRFRVGEYRMNQTGNALVATNVKEYNYTDFAKWLANQIRLKRRDFAKAKDTQKSTTSPLVFGEKSIASYGIVKRFTEEQGVLLRALYDSDKDPEARRLIQKTVCDWVELMDSDFDSIIKADPSAPYIGPSPQQSLFELSSLVYIASEISAEPKDLPGLVMRARKMATERHLRLPPNLMPSNQGWGAAYAAVSGAISAVLAYRDVSSHFEPQTIPLSELVTNTVGLNIGSMPRIITPSALVSLLSSGWFLPHPRVSRHMIGEKPWYLLEHPFTPFQLKVLLSLGDQTCLNTPQIEYLMALGARDFDVGCKISSTDPDTREAQRRVWARQAGTVATYDIGELHYVVYSRARVAQDPPQEAEYLATHTLIQRVKDDLLARGIIHYRLSAAVVSGLISFVTSLAFAAFTSWVINKISSGFPGAVIKTEEYKGVTRPAGTLLRHPDVTPAVPTILTPETFYEVFPKARSTNLEAVHTHTTDLGGTRRMDPKAHQWLRYPTGEDVWLPPGSFTAEEVAVSTFDGRHVKSGTKVVEAQASERPLNAVPIVDVSTKQWIQCPEGNQALVPLGSFTEEEMPHIVFRDGYACVPGKKILAEAHVYQSGKQPKAARKPIVLSGIVAHAGGHAFNTSNVQEQFRAIYGNFIRILPVLVADGIAETYNPLTGLFIGGTTFVTNYHAMHYVLGRAKDCQLKIYQGTECVTVELSQCAVRTRITDEDGSASDLVFITVPATKVSPKRQITQYFVSEANFTENYLYNTVMVTPDLKEKVPMFAVQHLEPGRLGDPIITKFADPTGEVHHYSVNPVAVFRGVSSQGDCMSLYACDSTSVQQPFFGFHDAGCSVTKNMYAVLVTREILESYLSTPPLKLRYDPIKEKVFAPSLPTGTEKHFDIVPNHAVSVAVTDPVYNHHLPMKSEYVRTRLFPDATITEAPAAMSLLALSNGVKKLDSPNRSVTNHLYKGIAGSYAKRIAEGCKPVTPIRFTDDDVLRGHPSDLRSHPTRLTTSAGAIAKTATKLPGKKGVIQEVNGIKTLTPVGRKLIAQIEKETDEGIPQRIDQVSIKDETRSLDRVAANKSRLFFSGDWAFAHFFSREFGAFFSAFNNNALVTRCMIGINPASSSWGTNISHVLGRNRLLLQGDISQNDIDVWRDVIATIFQVIEVWYRAHESPSDDPLGIHKRRRSRLATSMLGRFVQLGPLLIEIDHGLSSGVAHTTPLVSMARTLDFYSAVALLISEHYPDQFSEIINSKEGIFGTIRSMHYGDDMLGSVPPSMPRITLRELARVYKTYHGLTLTSPLKGEDLPDHYPWSELDFLARGLRLEHGIVWAPLREDTIHNILHWRLDDGVPDSIKLPELCDAALREWFQYGERTFRARKREYDTELLSLGLPSTSLSWAKALDDWRSGF